MGEFFNNFKRKFTAPKTRHMPKKINSAQDYLGLAKEEFTQMAKDAEFYKDAETKLSEARRKLKSGDELFNSPSILQEVTNYECITLNDRPGFKQSVTALTTENTAHLNDERLAMYQTFCRTCKQEIKDIFEQKKKQFSKEKTKLKALNDLINTFNLSKTSNKIITEWQRVSDWYDKNHSNLIDKEQNPVTQVYTKALEIAKTKVPKAIEDDINSLSKTTCDAMKAAKSNAKDQIKLEQTVTLLKMTFDGKVSEYKKICEDLGYQNTLKKIDTKENEVKEEMIETIEHYL